MKKIISYLSIATILVVLSSCEDVNVGNLFYTTYDVEARFEASMNYNATQKTFTQSVPEEYTFLVCSDLHINQEENPYITQFLQPNFHKNVHFIVYNGDLFQGQEAEAKKASELLKGQVIIPSYFSAGNHDLYFGWDLYNRYFGSSTYSFVMQSPSANDLFLVIESGSATLGSKQLAWLKDQLMNQRSKYRHCFIVTHTNFTQMHALNGIYMPDELHLLYRMFADYDVTGVLTGHAHAAHQTTYLGVPYYTTDALKNGAYGKMTVNDKEITWEFKQL